MDHFIVHEFPTFPGSFMWKQCIRYVSFPCIQFYVKTVCAKVLLHHTIMIWGEMFTLLNRIPARNITIAWLFIFIAQ
jgi:hypothetical protein